MSGAEARWFRHGGGHYYYHGGPGLVGGVIVGAATLATLPFAVLGAAVNPGPAYGPPPGYGPPGKVMDHRRFTDRRKDMGRLRVITGAVTACRRAMRHIEQRLIPDHLGSRAAAPCDAG